jgi:MIP family channel proteins
LSADLQRRLVAETVGTFGFFFAGFCGIASLSTQGSGAIAAIGIAAGFGFGLALMIFAFGHISGGHFNPAVTLGLSVAGRFSFRDVLPYWAAQIVGGVIAALVLRLIFTHAVLDAALTAPGHGVSVGNALVLEAIFTFLFVLVIGTVATDDRAPWSGVLAPVAIGLFIFTAASVAGPLSGGSFNPARSLTPALIAGHFSNLWIYIVGPLAGGALGGLLHGYFHPVSAPPKPKPAATAKAPARRRAA